MYAPLNTVSLPDWYYSVSGSSLVPTDTSFLPQNLERRYCCDVPGTCDVEVVSVHSQRVPSHLDTLTNELRPRRGFILPETLVQNATAGGNPK